MCFFRKIFGTKKVVVRVNGDTYRQTWSMIHRVDEAFTQTLKA